MNEQIEKLEHGLMICEATGTKLVHIEKADAEKIIGLLKDQESVIEALKSDLNETFKVLSEQPEIVRCKDCKYANRLTPHSNVHECASPNAREKICFQFHASDWFCADGERKSDG